MKFSLIVLVKYRSYVLGAVFLQLCKLLSLEEHPIVQKPVDPSLFIHRFTDRLFNGRKPNVSRTALHIVASMKRDWIQTGRKPSGLCGAALYISALSHGFKCTKSEIIKIVHICEATLTKRLIEFENTESGGLTIEEFNMRAEELEKEELIMKSPSTGFVPSCKIELLCEHKGSGKPPFAHGLCESCFSDFIKLSGGLDGGSEPPAFQRAERERMMATEAAADFSENLDSSTLLDPAGNKNSTVNPDEERSLKNVSENEVHLAESDLTGSTLQHEATNDSSNDRVDAAEFTLEESESLSDIEDIEVDFYILHDEVEKKLKKIVWETMNKEYIEEQAAKEAAELAAKKAYEASFANCSEDVQAAKKIAAAAAAAVKKERQMKRAAEIKNTGPAQTPAEATKQMLDKKRLSSKIRYDVLDKLFEDSENTEKSKRARVEPESNHDDGCADNSKEDVGTEGTQDAYDENVEEFDYDDEYNHFDDY